MLPLNWIYLPSGKCLLLTIFLTMVVSYNLSEAHMYTWPLPYGLSDGDMITLKGSLPIGGSSFHIDFGTENDLKKGDIFLHIAYRYAQDLIVLNTRNGSADWVAEERYADTGAVVAGRQFTILIVLKCDQYMITTNGRHFITFKVRNPSSGIKYMFIYTDKKLPFWVLGYCESPCLSLFKDMLEMMTVNGNTFADSTNEKCVSSNMVTCIPDSL
ncbi:putative lectin, galactoside-binding, soluble, 9 (galectin 9)-like 1 [Trypoxylus dichotomus]